MKKILSYLVLCVYATIMIKPVMPTVTDIFSHLLNYKEHMATVHKHGGKAHVHFEYIEASKKETNENSPYSNTLKKTGSSDEHLMFVTTRIVAMQPSLQNHRTWLPQNLPVISFNRDLRPPITVCA